MRTQLLPLATLAPSDESSLKRHTVAAGCEWRQTPSLTGLTARLAQARGSLSRAGSPVPDGGSSLHGVTPWQRGWSHRARHL